MLMEYGVSKVAGKHTSCLTWASEQVYRENSKNPAGAEGGGATSFLGTYSAPDLVPSTSHLLQVRTPRPGQDQSVAREEGQ